MEERFFARKKRGSWLVGFLFVVGLAAGAFVILTVGTEEGVFVPQITLKTRMPNVSGLLTGAPVRLEGYRVGTVNDIKFIEVEGKVQLEITFEVSSKVRKYIKKDSKCSIGTLGLLGDKFLGITAGSPEAPPVVDGDYLPASTPLDIEALMNRGVEVFEDFKASAQSLRDISEKINTGKGTLGKLVNDPNLYYNLSKMTEPLTKLWQKVESGEGTVSALFNDRAMYDSLITLLGKVNALVDTLNMAQGSFQAFVKNDTLYKTLTKTVSELERVLNNINEGKGSAGAIISDRELYEKLSRSIDEFNALLKDIKEHPSKYISIRIF
jgi:phospholipid/cholesterol/gamma-HCH transport system substrate-binding protein